MKNRIYLNNEWHFSETFETEMIKAEYDESRMEEVRLPHTCKETPFHYFDEHIYQMVSGYRRKIQADKEWQGKCILLTVDGAAHDCEVYLNGTKVGEHHCGYTAFTMDISEVLHYGEDNILTIKVDSRESLNIPPFGYVIDYMTYGGIYRDVYLDIKNPAYMEDVFLHAEVKTTEESGIAKLCTDITCKGNTDGMKICQFIRKMGSDTFEILGKEREVKGEKEVQLAWPVGKVDLWEINQPVLYEIKTQLCMKEEVVDENITVYGFRKAEFRKDGFYLNDKKVRIRGLNRHQSYPYVGYAMPKSMQCMDANILKEELGLNAVRTSHYPQSHYFLNRCDEIGLLVFTEIPGWQHIGDENWKAQAVENVREMVRQYRNHPSIILWGVRINESQDDDAFYEKTNAMAKSLDPYRQTGGVRAHKKSSLLEDVYTYNDFSHDGNKRATRQGGDTYCTPGCEHKKNVTSDMEKPYLVTEYNGHMYPTKAFDWEEHRVEHAIRHANVLNAVAGEEDICGSFGWCMTDYNTHKDFGSGDRICYHGVMDMFRNPKLAADIYAAQQEKKVILSLSSTMDIGEHPGCNRGKTWIISNADSVKMYKNDRFIKEYKNSDSNYKNLAHGPIEIDDFIGDDIAEGENFTPKQAEEIKMALNYVARNGLSNLPKKIIFTALKMMVVYRMKPTKAVVLYNKYIGDWGGTSTVYKFEAIKDGKVVKTITKEPMTQMHLCAEADHKLLKEDHTYDVAAVRIRMLDEHDNQMYFYNEPVLLETEGPIELIGEKIISFKGGMCGTYIKTTGREGKAALILKNAQAKEVRIGFEVKCWDGRNIDRNANIIRKK